MACFTLLITVTVSPLSFLCELFLNDKGDYRNYI